MTNLERFNIASKPFITTNELIAISGLAINKCKLITKEIREHLDELPDGEKIVTPRGAVPTEMVLKKIGKTVNHFHRMAKLERGLYETKNITGNTIRK